ncbi:GNAT family N-acetyltransferase [Dialister sp.]|uniref:GNAT family N-acetyltransferase n=1 Tax=Dialister sp. TaxID=1955814 RepID=UPI003F04AB30
MKDTDGLSFRTAEKKDLPQILEMLHVLASYEHLEKQLAITEEIINDWFFRRQVLTALLEEKDGQVIGMATYYETYSTFRGRTGLYLEDLIVRPEMRGRGCGRKLLMHYLALAEKQGCYEASWNCLAWNQASRSFYKSIGAEEEKEWIRYHISTAQIDAALKKAD